MNDPAHWLMLVNSLPTQNARVRMRLWRTVKSLGCAIIRDGVYLLPQSPEGESALQELVETTRGAGGSAHLLRVSGRGSEQADEFKALFERGAEYSEFLAGVTRFRASLEARKPAELRRELRALNRQFNAISEIDFFPGDARRQARTVFREVEALALDVVSPDKPSTVTGEIGPKDRRLYQQRRWATRKHPWVDRLASAWLIHRFIDPRARFIWLDHPEDSPRDAIGFDFNGAEFSHFGNKVTFEVLVASFDLDSDPALERIGRLVHYMDVGGGKRVPEAAGIETLLAGARETCDSDDKLLVEGKKTFEFLYSAYAD